jgi:hypothetical protein
MSEEKQRRLYFSKCQDMTAEAYCVSKLTISRTFREAKKGKEEGTKKLFMSPRKRTDIPK